MRKVEKTVTIWYSAHQMYELVIDAESYPQFLPWCSSAKILERRPDGLLADLGLSIAGLEQKFTTRTTHIQDQTVTIDLVKGPFSSLHCQWNFSSLPAVKHTDTPSHACKIHFQANYEFSNRLLAMAVGIVFDKMMDTFVDAFIKRAENIYGKPKLF